MNCPSSSFIHPSSSFTRNTYTTISAATTQVSTKATREDTDTTFQAFADSLDEDDLFSDNESTSESSSTSSSVYDKEPTWQESLESFLNPTTPIAKKQVLFSDLINANGRIRQDVETAIKDRKIDPLLTPTGKKLQDGTKAVQRQITTDILPSIAQGVATSTTSGEIPRPKDATSPQELTNLVPKIGSRIFDAMSNQAKKQMELIQGDLADPSRIPERISRETQNVVTEAKNVFLETPIGLEGPKYTVVEEGEGYEIREYEGYTVASTSMAMVGEPFSMDDVTKSGAAFNALAAYLFGANDEGRVMDMTTPVTMTSLGEMRFYLEKEDATSSSNGFPEPLSREDGYNEQGIVKVSEVPPARLAVARFTGFATEGEVSRQKDALLSSLMMDGIEVDVPHGAVVPHVVFQYNPPYTIPIVRRNEIGVPVSINSGDNVDSGDEIGGVESSLEQQWKNDV
jgi:hypothetical protein